MILIPAPYLKPINALNVVSFFKIQMHDDVIVKSHLAFQDVGILKKLTDNSVPCFIARLTFRLLWLCKLNVVGWRLSSHQKYKKDMSTDC